jgi:hypothetical protein
VEARNQAFPTSNQPEGAIQKLSEPIRRLFDKLFTLVSEVGEPAGYTDYAVVAE